MNFDQSKFKSFEEIIFQNGSLEIKTAILFISANKKPNIWNYKNYSKIILELISHNFKIILLGTKNDIDQINLLKSSLDIKNENLIDLTGNTSFEDLFYICQMVDLSISNDTGIIHITNLFNIRTFAINLKKNLLQGWVFPY
jgi:ADP-heptose:LPS heptosyltransferase